MHEDYPMDTLHLIAEIGNITDFEPAFMPYEPTPADWADYAEAQREHEARELEDRRDTLERIRRDEFNAARSAACRVRGIAACLGAQGMDGIARQLLAASEDVLNLVMKYA